MIKILKNLLLVSIIPIIAIALAIHFENKIEKNWQESLNKEFGYEKASSLLYYELETFCTSTEVNNEAMEFCEYPRYSYYIRNTAYFILSLGVLLILFIAISGKLARNNRTYLLRVFKSGLYFTIISLAIIIVGSALLSIIIIYFLESIALGVVHIKILGLIGLGAIVGSYQILKSSFSIVHTNHLDVNGLAYDTHELGSLSALIFEVTELCNSKPPNNIILGLEASFFVTEGSIACNNKTTKGSSLFISLPLCRILTINELKSILAHEFSHFTGDDTKFSKEFYPIYKGTLESLDVINQQIESHNLSFSFYPAAYILGFFFESFSLAESNIGRARELRADTIAAEKIDKFSFGSALLKVYTFSEAWNRINSEMYSKLKSDENILNASFEFQKLVNDHSFKEESLSDLDKHSIIHPTDSHPPLNERISNLSVDLEELKTKLISSDIETTSETIIPGFESLELELTDYLNRRYLDYIETYDKENVA